jgi:hypothetical protein
MTVFEKLGLQKLGGRRMPRVDVRRLARLLPFVERHFLILATCILLVFVLARTDDWLYRNEVFSWLSSGIQFEANDPSLLAFRDAAIDNCRNVQDEAISVCRDYQSTFLDSMHFFRPLHGFFGARLLDTYGEGPWLEDLHRAAMWPHLLGGLLAVGLWLLFVVCLPPGLRNLVATLTLLLIVLGYYRDEPTVILPDPFADGVQAWEVAALAVIAAAILFGGRLYERFVLYGGLGLPEKIAQHRTRVLQAFLLVLLVNLALPPIGAAVAQLVAFAALLVAIWWLVSEEDVSPLMAGAILVLLFIMVSGDHHFLLRKLEVSRKQLYLVFGVYLTYAAVRPRGVLVYLLPAFAILHVPATALFGLALFLAELPLCLRRLRITPLLVVSAVSFAGWHFYMQSTQTNLVDQSNLAVSHIASMVLDSPRLWPTVLVLALMAAVSLWPLLQRDDRWDHVARCGVLAMQGLGASFISFAILDADPGLRLAAGYFEFANLQKYLGPPVAFGVVLGLSVVLYQMFAQDGGAETEQRDVAGFGWRRIAPIVAVVLLMGVAKIDLVPRFLVFDALRNTVVYVALGEVHPKWCRFLAQAAGFDDHYVLSARKPTSGVENAFSALKLKLRTAAGVHDPEQMRVTAAEAREDGC